MNLGWGGGRWSEKHLTVTKDATDWKHCCCCSVSCVRFGGPCGLKPTRLSYFPELAQTHVHWVSDAMPPPHPLVPPLLPASIFPSIKVFSNELARHIRWPKYWSFSFSIISSNENSRLISFRIDWFDLLAGTLKSLLQHHSSKASILQHLTFFMVQLSYLYMTTGKNHSSDYTDLCQQSDISVF